MTTNNFFKSDLARIHNIVSNSMNVWPKELVIATLRDFFSHDTWYHFQVDKFGFPHTPDHTDLPLDAGLINSLTTRVNIAEYNRFDVIYYPSITVRMGGSSYVPISLNRETSSIQWEDMIFEDGYGNIQVFKTPSHLIFTGAWEGSLNIDVRAKDIRARDELVDFISLLFTDIAFNNLVKSGLVIKGVSCGSPGTEEDRNDKLHTQSVILQIRSEWRREIPVGNLVEIISTSIEFGRLDPTPGPIAQNLTINITETLADMLSSL